MKKEISFEKALDRLAEINEKLESEEISLDDIEKVWTGALEGVFATKADYEDVGMKKFAYPINYRSEGFYVLVNFTAEDKAPNVIAKTLNITDNIVRQMIVAK